MPRSARRSGLSQENESEAFENQRAQGENVSAGGADVSEEELRMALEKGQPENICPVVLQKRKSPGEACFKY